MELLLFQFTLDPDIIKTLVASLLAGIPGWIAFILERRKRKLDVGKTEFDYIKVSQEEIVEVYNQLKDAKREIIKVERSLHEKTISLEECLSEKNDCSECEERSLELIKEAERILSQATTYDLPDLLKHLDALKVQFELHRSRNEQFNTSDRSGSPT